MSRVSGTILNSTNLTNRWSACRGMTLLHTRSGRARLCQPRRSGRRRRAVRWLVSSIHGAILGRHLPMRAISTMRRLKVIPMAMLIPHLLGVSTQMAMDSTTWRVMLSNGVSMPTKPTIIPKAPNTIPSKTSLWIYACFAWCEEVDGVV